MHCPVDQTTLQMTERQGVEIDYCPSCRGVWLDRGELDKIIERGSPAAPAAAPATTPDPRTERAGYPQQQGYQQQGFQQPPAYQQPPQSYQQPYPQQRFGYGSPGSPDSPNRYDPRYANDPRYQKRRKKNFLDDLFDF